MEKRTLEAFKDKIRKEKSAKKMLESSQEKFDVAKMVGEKLTEIMQAGKLPWDMPWVKNPAISGETGKKYSLLNQFLLGRGGEWLTFKQITARGGKLRKGEKCRIAVFWKLYDYTVKDESGNPMTDEDGDNITKRRAVLRYYKVWNIDQCEGIEPKYERPMPGLADIDESAESLFRGYTNHEGIEVKQNSEISAYSPILDKIILPDRCQFKDVARFYSTVFHECVHSTGAKKRLNRDGVTSRNVEFGDCEYSKEELIAEIGAATLCQLIGINTEESERNSAAYVQNWLKVLNNDPGMIIAACGAAEKAVDYIREKAGIPA